MSLTNEKKAETGKCSEFLEYIRYSIDTDRISENWDLEVEIKNEMMLLSIKSTKPFNEIETEYIVNSVDDFELFKFEELRPLGWCSSSKIVKSIPGHIEFAWLKTSNDLMKCSCQVCSDRFSKHE